jgi:ABC-type oligopeptide transport system substrate-binding subunit
MFRSDDTVLKADGKDYSVPATGYWDTVSVRVVDDHTVEVTSKKAGKPMFTETDTVSVEGNTLTQAVKDTTEAEAVTFESLYKRVTHAPPGAHVLSGT